MKMDKIDRINQIKDRTIELIANYGSVDLLRTKDIADAIDASEATIYKYFESKDHILESILMDYISNRPLEFDHKNIDTLEKFKSSLQKIMDLTFDNSLYRNNHIALILCSSLKKNAIAQWNYNNIKKEVWNYLEDRIEHGKEHWNFNMSLNAGIQARLFYYAPLMFYIQMEIFEGKKIESFDYSLVIENHINNFLKILLK